jgi:hypothetical protein
MRWPLLLLPLLLFLAVACSDRDRPAPVPSPTGPAVTPTALPGSPQPSSAPVTPVEAACAGQGTVVNGLLVVPLAAPEPSCTRQAIARDPAQRFELALPPGLYRQEESAAGAVSLVIYWSNDPSSGREVAAITIRRRGAFEEPPVVRADRAEPFAGLPRPGVLVRRTEGYTLTWRGPGGVFELDVLSERFAVGPEKAAALLVDVAQAAYRPPPPPWWVYPVTAGSGIPVVDAAIAAVASNRIPDQLRPGLVPCGPAASGPLPPPACPAGAPAGTLVPALVHGGCGVSWQPLSLGRADLVEAFGSGSGGFVGLYAAVRSDGHDGVRYQLVYALAGRFGVVAVSNEGIMGAALCDPEPIHAWLREVRRYVLPPLIP